MTKVNVYLLSGLNLLGPTALRPFFIDFSLLPGSPHILLACTAKQSHIINLTGYINTHTSKALELKHVTEAAMLDLNIVLLNQYPPVRDFDDVVCELHALKRHGLSPHTCAWAINKSLEGGT